MGSDFGDLGVMARCRASDGEEGEGTSSLPFYCLNIIFYRKRGV